MNRQSLSGQLADRLRRKIGQGGFGEGRLPTVRELARLHGVSVITVREALASLKQQGLIAVRHGSGIYVNARRETRPVALVAKADVTRTYFSDFSLLLLQHLQIALHRNGLRARLYLRTRDPRGDLSESDAPDLLNDLQNGELGGVIAVNGRLHARWLDAIRQLQIPQIGGEDAPYPARFDTETALRQAAAWLAAAGRRRVAVLEWARRRDPSPERAACPYPIREALERAGLEYDERRCAQAFHPLDGGAGWEAFRELWVARTEKPDALIVTDDVLFRDLVQAVQELRIRVPEQLMLVVMTARGIALRSPFPVARIEMDPEALAAGVADAMARLMRGETLPPKAAVLPCAFIPDGNGDAVVESAEEAVGAMRL